jgi:hypothetical protein
MLFAQFMNWLDREGFRRAPDVPSFIDTETGRWLQADVIAFRLNASEPR